MQYRTPREQLAYRWNDDPAAAVRPLSIDDRFCRGSYHVVIRYSYRYRQTNSERQRRFKLTKPATRRSLQEHRNAEIQGGDCCNP